jgi:hypothetical protein
VNDDLVDDYDQKIRQDQTQIYEIRIKGPLDADWSDWFEGMSVKLDEDGNTLISGPVVDQAALYSLLKKVHQIGLQLISINEIDCLESKKTRKGDK